MDLPLRARQLAFDLVHEESFSRDDFLVGGSNAEAMALIDRWPDWPAPVVTLLGPAGSGKSHLAAIWAAESGARFLSGRALEGADLPAALATGALVIEDLPSQGFDERALFHLLNLVREFEASVLLTGRSAPTAVLPDLASRLRAVPVVRIGVPDDPLLRMVLFKLFADRQVQVDERLVDFLVGRIERSVSVAKATVERLDSEALRLKRPVSRALAAEMFSP